VYRKPSSCRLIIEFRPSSSLSSPNLSLLDLFHFLDVPKIGARGGPWKKLISRHCFFISFSVIMGNEQSAPTSRRAQNKLSKPRTNNNSTSNLLNVKTSNPTTRQNSVSTNASPTNIRYSVIPIDEFIRGAGEKRKEETTQRKRMSIFRSKSAQEKPKLRLDVGVKSSSVESSPLEQRNPRRSRQRRERGTPVIFELAGDEPDSESPVEM
jgi:hypothetical protein